MNEKYIRYLFQLARDEQYPGSMDEFVKRIQTEDNFFNYMLQSARDDQYKGTDEEFSIAIGRTKSQSTQSEPVATEQTAKAEPTTTEPAKVEPTKVEPQATETVIAKAEDPVKEQVVEEKPAIQVKEVEALKEEVVKKEIPKESLNQNIIPITEKTEVKAVEPTSDKMVVKSEKKEEVKEQPKTEGKPQMEVKDVTKEEPKNLKVKSLDEKVIEENKKSMEYPTPPSETVFDVKKIKGKELYSSYDKENNKWYTYPVGSNKKEWTEVKSGQMKSALNAMFTSNKLDTLKLESKAKEIKADIPKFNINDPNEIYKPYGEEGPDVYYSKENDQYIVKDGEKRNIIEKDSGEYALINSRIKNAIDNSKLGKGECPERQGGCSKNKSTVDEYRYKKAGLKHQDETYIDHNNKPSRITKTVYTKDKKYGNGAWITDREGNLASYIDDSGDAIALTDRYYSEYYNHEEDALFYVAEEAPKSKRFPVYKPFGENGKSFIYDNNTGIIMRELTEDKIMSKDGSPMTVWKDIPMFEPEYKKAKAIIEGLKFQKEKGSKNTFVPLTTTPGMQDWSPIPNKK